MNRFKTGYNTFTIGILLILIMGVLFFYNGIPNILTWDVMGYNSYLPLIFEQHSFDVNLDYFRVINERYDYSSTLYQYVDLPNGNVYIKYTMGWAILFTPFYLIAEVWASWGGYVSDGFSYPYQVMAYLGSFFYFILSIVLLRRVLRLFFNERIGATVLLIIGLGTNYFYMNCGSAGVTHNLVFMLVCFLILRTHSFHENVTVKNAILLGVSIGLIALTRTPSVVLGLFAVFYSYKKFGSSVISKIVFFLRSKTGYVLIAILAVVLTFLPQVIYWKLTSGSFLINSYANNPGEGMDWSTPYMSEVLFSFRNGWLIYSPVMIFAVIGFYYWIKNDRSTGIGALLTFLVFFYVVSCWTTWWYPIPFGHRGMIDCYPILAVSLGYFIKDFGKKWVMALIGLMILLNLFQTYQVRKRIFHASRMTREAYCSVFLQTTPMTAQQKLLLAIDEADLESAAVHLSDDFKLLYTDSLVFDNFVLSQKNPYAPGITLYPGKIKDVQHLLVRSEWSYEGSPRQLEGKIFNEHMKYEDQVYGWRGKQYKDINMIHDSVNKRVIFNYVVPHLRTKRDETYTGLWAQSGDSIVVNGLKVGVYEWNPKK